MNKISDIIIGIDPDVNKSGIAVLDTQTKTCTLKSLSFPELIDYLQKAKGFNEEIIIVVEAGWLNKKSDFYSIKGTRGQRRAKDVGRNHEVGRKIVEMCKHYGYQVVEKRPLEKIWKGPDRKITHEELTQFIETGKSRTNQEQRDAALIAWNYAGFLIKLN